MSSGVHSLETMHKPLEAEVKLEPVATEGGNMFAPEVVAENRKVSAPVPPHSTYVDNDKRQLSCFHLSSRYLSFSEKKKRVVGAVLQESFLFGGPDTPSKYTCMLAPALDTPPPAPLWSGPQHPYDNKR